MHDDWPEGCESESEAIAGVVADKLSRRSGLSVASFVSHSVSTTESFSNPLLEIYHHTEVT